MDDDWESEDDGKEMQLKEWKRVEKNLEKTGYKEGMESSQEETLQAGFNQSFKQAMAMAFGAGRLQGGICASVGNNFLTAEQDSNKSSDILGNMNNSISSLLSEISDILSPSETGSCQSCSCTSDYDPSGVIVANKDLVQSYWNRLDKIQENAEKEDKYLDSSLPSQD